MCIVYIIREKEREEGRERESLAAVRVAYTERGGIPDIPRPSLAEEKKKVHERRRGLRGRENTRA